MLTCLQSMLYNLWCVLLWIFFFLCWTQQSLKFITLDKPSLCSPGLKNLDHSISFLTFFLKFSNTQGNIFYLSYKFHIKLILISFLNTGCFIVAVNIFQTKVEFCWLYPVAYSLYHNSTILLFIIGNWFGVHWPVQHQIVYHPIINHHSYPDTQTQMRASKTESCEVNWLWEFCADN